MSRFFLYRLRTTDVAGARAFYAAVLGKDEAEIFQLHEQAIARGARPHWLGFVDVGDVDAAAAAFVGLGASPLGPKWIDASGLAAAVVRDPGGAVVALARPAPGSRASRAPAEESPGTAGPDVVWHLLHTTDVERATASYRELGGWDFKEPLDFEGLGVVHPFSWDAGGAAVGWLTDITGRPEVHPHWLFHFRVKALDPALEAVRAGGGLVVGPFVTPSGGRVAVCDDPQGAAFALIEGG